MAIVKGTVTQDSNTGLATISFSHTQDVGSDRLLVVQVHWQDDDDATFVTGITYGGQALSFLGQSTNPSRARVEFWYLINPPTGANTVAVTLNDVVSDELMVGARSFTGVDQTQPFGAFASAIGNDANPSVVVNAVATDLVIDGFTARNQGTDPSQGAGQTLDYRFGVSFTHAAGGSSEPGAAPSVTMDWTIGSSDRWATGGVALQEAAPPPAVGSQELNPGSVNVAGIATIV